MIILTDCGAIGCLVVSHATSMKMAIIGETIVAFSGGVQPLLHAVKSEVLPRRYKPIAQGAINTTATLGGSVRLLVGEDPSNLYSYRLADFNNNFQGVL